LMFSVEILTLDTFYRPQASFIRFRFSMFFESSVSSSLRWFS